MATKSSVALADFSLPPDILAEIERLNAEAAPHHIWLRTRANAPQKKPWHHVNGDPNSAAVLYTFNDTPL